MSSSKYKVLGQILKYARKQVKMSQVELAQALGVTQGTISKFENGDMLPSLVVALKLSQELDMAVIPTKEELAIAELAGLTND